MNASRTDGPIFVLAGLLALLCGAGCQTSTPTIGIPLFGPVAGGEPLPPTELDYAVRDLAAAALAGAEPEMDSALERIQLLHDDAAIDRAEEEGRPRMEGLVPLSVDLRNATLADPIAYREASEELLDEWFLYLDPALQARLEQAVADDPLDLANKRTLDHWESLWASTFNAVVEPIGGSFAFGVAIAPFRLATRLSHWAAQMYSRPPMSVQQRQALAQRRLYVEKHPDAADTPKVREVVAAGEEKYDEMQADHFADLAGKSLDRGRYRLAELQAQRALRIDPETEDAASFGAVARATAARTEQLRRDSMQTSSAPLLDLELKGLLEELLASSNLSETSWALPSADPSDRIQEQRRLERIADQARILKREDPDGPLADEAEYVLALAQRDLGNETQSWKKLHGLAAQNPRGSNMQRHARALLADPWQNTLGNFERQKRRALDKAVAFRLFGGHSLGRRYPDLPFGLSYLVELPSIVQSVVLAPLRLIAGPWDPPGKDLERAPAIAGYRYLAREPEGEHARRVSSWLYEYETDRENWVAALRLHDLQPTPGADPTLRLELIENAASQKLAAASRAGRRDWRGSILRGVAEEFPDSDAALRASVQLRGEFDNVSPQRIRVTKGFMEENPEVAGPYGLAIHPALLDGDLYNGELHPEGVTFLGTSVLEFALVAESGDEDDPPETVREKITPERLAQAVAKLDETVLLNNQIDDGDAVTPDAYRDHYLERARLGLIEEPDMRPTASSSYVYESLREQYGMVRARDSYLPFDLVFQGSLGDLSLGAFPRWRQPKETPDAFLYR